MAINKCENGTCEFNDEMLQDHVAHRLLNDTLLIVRRMSFGKFRLLICDSAPPAYMIYGDF